MPHPGSLDQRPRFQGAQDQFTHIQGVAPSDLPELLPRTSLDRAAQGQVQERVKMRPAEVVQVDSLRPAVPSQAGQQVRDRLAGAHGGDQEDRSLRGQIREQGQRRGIEQGHVIGDGHDPMPAVALVQGPAGLFE